MKPTTPYILSGILVAFVIAAGIFGYTSFKQKVPTSYVINNNGTPSTLNTKTGVVTKGVATFSLSDIAQHTNTSSCYTTVSGSVYDLTLFITKHEGGNQPILSMCGHDGTDAFMAQHAGKQKIMRVLTRFKIGTLS